MSNQTKDSSALPADDKRDILRQRRLFLEQQRDAVYARRKILGVFEEETWLAKILRIVLRLAGVLHRGYRNAENPTIRRIVLPFDDLPEGFDGYRILHLSDLHFSAKHGVSKRALDTLRTVTADVCVITGDFLWGKSGPCAPVFERTAELVLNIVVSDGIYAVLGNHDRIQFIDPLAKMGIRVLLNESFPIQRGNAALWFCGVDDPSFFKTADLDTALSAVSEQAFVILLAHSPDLAEQAFVRGVRLYLCGHTHAGQICFPGIGAVHYNCRAPRKICRGLWRLGTMTGYTSAGLGTTELPVRYNCPPEITLIELVKG